MIDFFRCIKNSRGQKNDFHLLDLHLLDHHHRHEHPRSSPCYSEPCTYTSDFHVCEPPIVSLQGGTRKGLPCITCLWSIDKGDPKGAPLHYICHMDISCHIGLVWWVSGKETTPHAMLWWISGLPGFQKPFCSKCKLSKHMQFLEMHTGSETKPPQPCSGPTTQ